MSSIICRIITDPALPTGAGRACKTHKTHLKSRRPIGAAAFAAGLTTCTRRPNPAHPLRHRLLRGPCLIGGRGLGRGEAFCEGELFGTGWGVGMKKSRRDGSRWDLFERERGEDEKTKYAGKMLLPVHRGSGEPTSFMPIEYRKSRFLWRTVCKRTMKNPEEIKIRGHLQWHRDGAWRKKPGGGKWRTRIRTTNNRLEQESATVK